MFDVRHTTKRRGDLMSDPPTYGKNLGGVEGVAHGSEVSVGLLSAAFVMLACTRVFDDMWSGGLG